MNKKMNRSIVTLAICAAMIGACQSTFAQCAGGMCGARVGFFGRLFGGYQTAYAPRYSAPTCPNGQCPTSQPAAAYRSVCPNGQCPTSQPAAAYRSVCPNGQCPFTPAASEIETTPGIDEPIEAVETTTETPEPCAPIETSETAPPCYAVETTEETPEPCAPIETSETSETIQPCEPVETSTCETCETIQPCEPVETSTCETCETLQPCAPVETSTCETCETLQPCAPVSTCEKKTALKPERPRPVGTAVGAAVQAPRKIAQRVAETIELAKANRIRARYGAGPLTMDAGLSASAAAHCQTMASYGRIFHAPGCGWEIVAMNYGAGMLGALDQWTNSAAHFRILTNGGLTRVGVGHVRDRYGRDFCTMRFR